MPDCKRRTNEASVDVEVAWEQRAQAQASGGRRGGRVLQVETFGPSHLSSRGRPTRSSSVSSTAPTSDWRSTSTATSPGRADRRTHQGRHPRRQPRCFSDPSVPFGGVRMSGIGPMADGSGSRELQETQYLSVDWT